MCTWTNSARAREWYIFDEAREWYLVRQLQASADSNALTISTLQLTLHTLDGWMQEEL